METVRVALANVRAPSTRDESVSIALDAIHEAAIRHAQVICFPECYVPGYRIGQSTNTPDQDWLDRAWAAIDAKAGECGVAVVLGTERIDSDAHYITTRVTNSDGSFAGFQDKVQLDPSEESTYSAGHRRRVFQCGKLTFGVVICHEGWRYPETVRWAVRQGAHLVFHPHFELIEDPQYLPVRFADPENTFHEKAALCRAAENTCYFATVNCALQGATTTSAVVDPDGSVVVHQPYGIEGLLLADIDLTKATGFLAHRLHTDLPDTDGTT